MAFNPTNPVSVGDATRKSHYDRVFDNVIALQDGSKEFDEININNIGPTSEPFYAHDGNGGCLFRVMTSVTTSQDVIADGARDAPNGFYAIGVCWVATGVTAASEFSVGVDKHTIIKNPTIATLTNGTWNIRWNSDGSVDVYRISGSESATIAIFVVWT